MSKNNEFRYVVSSNNSDIDLRLRWTKKCVHIFVHLSQTREKNNLGSGYSKNNTATLKVNRYRPSRRRPTSQDSLHGEAGTWAYPDTRGFPTLTGGHRLYPNCTSVQCTDKNAGQEPRPGTGTLRPLVIGPARGLEADHGGRRIHIRNDQWNVLDAKSELQHVFRCRSSQSGETSTAE